MSANGPDTSLDPMGLINSFQDRWGGLGKATEAGIGGVIVTVLGGLALGVDTVRRLFTDPLIAVINGVSGLMDAIIGGAGDIIEQGVRTTVTSIAPGATWAVGPLTYGFSIVAVGVGLYVLAQILESRATSDLIPFTFTDWPLIGADEEGEE